MPTYLIGDVQGCWHSLEKLLTHIHFDPARDRLGFVGDLVNRGPHSLEVLRFIRGLNDPLVVLGNHDIYAIILAHEAMAREQYEHTLDELLDAPDAPDLLTWLTQQPLMRTLPEHNIMMMHAGIPPQWSLNGAQTHSDEFSQLMQSPDALGFLHACFGNEPTSWSDNLNKHDRLRYIVNAFTRMRFCDANGTLDLTVSSATHPKPNRMQPWFTHRHDDALDIAFGHWASLNNPQPTPHCYALDSGCVWGNVLTALRLEDRAWFSVDAADT